MLLLLLLLLSRVRQVELCEALRCSVAALQQEREALREEQHHHRALGASIESLVQERLKANEKDKYSVFVGETAGGCVWKRVRFCWARLCLQL